MAKETVGGHGDKVDTGGGQNSAEEWADAPRGYAVNPIVCHVSEGNKPQRVLRWYCYTIADSTVEPLSPSPDLLYPLSALNEEERCNETTTWTSIIQQKKEGIEVARIY